MSVPAPILLQHARASAGRFGRLLLTGLVLLGPGSLCSGATLLVGAAGGGAWTLTLDGTSYPCAVGRAGVARAGAKREGDGMTPSGVFPLRGLWFRADQVDGAKLPAVWGPRAIARTDGWCDDPRDAAYNRPVPLPFPARHEDLWRPDGLYDLVVPIGYNDDPAVPGLGSAIFLHVAAPGYGPTSGCVALAKEDLLALLQRLQPGDLIEIRP